MVSKMRVGRIRSSTVVFILYYTNRVSLCEQDIDVDSRQTGIDRDRSSKYRSLKKSTGAKNSIGCGWQWLQIKIRCFAVFSEMGLHL